MKKWLLALGVWMIFALAWSCQTTEAPQQEVVLASVGDTSVETEEELPIKEAIAVDSSITLEYLMGQFEPTKDKRFVKVTAPYASRAGLLMREEAYVDFVRMAEAAAKEGIVFKVISATRNFNRQKSIWEAKWTGARKVDGQNLAQSIKDPVARARKILQWSSMPGSSRHHWGTDIDINALENNYFATGRGQKEYTWLQAHAAAYGFCQPYSPKGADRPEGYNEEKWHWSYLPLAQPLSQQVKLRLKNEMIKGFNGAEAAVGVGIVENYVLGINPTCQ